MQSSLGTCLFNAWEEHIHIWTCSNMYICLGLCLFTLFVFCKFWLLNWIFFWLILVIQTNRSNHRRCPLRKVFLEISQNPQENTCARVSFLSCRPQPEHLFYRTSTGDCFRTNIFTMLPCFVNSFLNKGIMDEI